MSRIVITNKSKGTLPRVPFSRIKDAVLGRDYELSLVFVSDAKAKSLNEKYRGKSYVPNVLSFELDTDAGEIFINPKEAERQMKSFGKSKRDMIALLFIHGLFHLKGMSHGGKMDKAETKIRKKFGI